jgi:hypothetical protein
MVHAHSLVPTITHTHTHTAEDFAARWAKGGFGPGTEGDVAELLGGADPAQAVRVCVCVCVCVCVYLFL